MRYAFALFLGAFGWIALLIFWWVGNLGAPHQTLIMWDLYGEWMLEGLVFHWGFALYLHLMWGERKK